MRRNCQVIIIFFAIQSSCNLRDTLTDQNIICHVLELKLFIGGLPREANEKDITEYFSKFGEVVSVNLKRDLKSGRSRGFAFIVFQTDVIINPILGNHHMICGKRVAVDLAQKEYQKVCIRSHKKYDQNLNSQKFSSRSKQLEVVEGLDQLQLIVEVSEDVAYQPIVEVSEVALEDVDQP